MRKYARQAKICTPPGGEVIAKICVLSDLKISAECVYSVGTMPCAPSRVGRSLVMTD